MAVENCFLLKFKIEYGSQSKQQENCGNDIEADLRGFLHSLALGTPGEESCIAQSLYKRTVEQSGGGGIETALDQVEGQEGGDQELCDLFSGDSCHIQGGEDVVPCQHHSYHGTHTDTQTQNGTLQGVLPLINQGGREGKGTGRQDVHGKSDEARFADG